MKFWPFGKASQPARRNPPPQLRRSYSAAMTEARFSDFSRSKGSADYELMIGLAAVREKARNLARNSNTMRRYIRLLQQNVVGPAGFVYRCRVKMNNGKLDITLNQDVEWAFWRWMQRPTVDGVMTGHEMQKQAVATWARDGEYFIEIVTNTAYVDGIALNPIESDMVDETLNTINPSTGNQIKMGVEVDSYGRPVAYHILTQHPGDPGWYSKSAAKKYRRVDASKIIHVYERLRPGQTRGEPPAAAAVNPVKMLDGYREAEVTGRRIAASVMGFFKRVLPQASQIDAIADRPVIDEEAQFEIDMSPGTFKQLPDGMDFTKFEATGSQTDYRQFETQVKKDIAMGLNISNFSLGMETEAVSFSTGRSVLLEDRDYYKMVQKFFIDSMMTPVFMAWLKSHIISDMPVIAPSKVRKVMDQSIFHGRGWDWVDPAKDVSANAEALRTRQTSLSRVAAQRGIDLADLLQEIADDEAMLKDHGLTLTVETATANSGKDTQDDDEPSSASDDTDSQG